MYTATALVKGVKGRVEICSADDLETCQLDANREMALHPVYKNIAIETTRVVSVNINGKWQPLQNSMIAR